MFATPDRELVPVCVRGVRSGAAAPDGLTPVQADVIGAVAAQVSHHAAGDPATLESMPLAPSHVGPKHLPGEDPAPSVPTLVVPEG